MIRRTIFDYQGSEIGYIEFPDGTPEETISRKVSEYALPPPEVHIPDVTPRQIRQALILKGVPLSAIDAAISALPEPTRTLAQVEWEFSTMILRSNPLVAEVGAAIGWTSSQIDDLFIFAHSL